MALEVLGELGIDTGELRSKSWTEFSGEEAPQMDLIITVCDNAAGESCPVWPERPIIAHWSIKDPASIGGEGQKAAFQAALRYLHNRISLLLNLGDDALSERKLGPIGRSEGATGMMPAS